MKPLGSQKSTGSTRRWLRRALPVVAAILAVLAYARWIEPAWLETEEVELEIQGLPVGLERLNIVLFSDLHAERVGRVERQLVDRVQELDPDLILYAGDFITQRYYMYQCLRNMAVACSLMAIMPARYGKFAVWGNNDLPVEMAELAESAGITVLYNEWTRVSLPGGELTLIGLGDTLTGLADWDATLAETPRGPMLMMAHSPDAFPKAAEMGVPVLLVGHTHGGQIRHPFIEWAPGFFLRLLPGTPAYRAGLYQRDESTLYVTRGISTSYFKFRFLCRPELTRVQLVRESGR